ncbi:MAG: PAS domain S-box protein, partial [Promethearchaeota archaeon]
MNFEKTVSLISSRFVGKINLEDVINDCIQDMGTLSRANRVSLFLFNQEKSIIVETNQWSDQQYDSKCEKFQALPIDVIYFWISQVTDLNYILPPEAKTMKNLMKECDIKCFLGFPVRIDTELIGFICFSKIDEKISWKGKDFTILRIFAELLGSTMERLQAEKSLRKSRELLRATFEATADGIIAINKKGKVSQINARFAYMWHIPDDIIEKKDFKTIIAFIVDQLKDPESFLAKLENMQETSEDAYDMILFKDGRVFEEYSCPMFSEGEKVGRVWSFKDISEHQHAEKALKESEKKYRQAYERAEFFKDIFTHDMSNIFHNILSTAELHSLLQDYPSNSEDLSKFYEISKNQLQRGVKLINNIRKLSQLEESDIMLEAVEIHKILEEAIVFANKSSTGKNLNVKIKNQKAKEHFVLANEFLLDVFENLLHNAIKYNENPTINVKILISRV